jgi:serine/threonine protein kinase
MEPLSANDPRMIGEFRLHAQLGAGGMGQVYLGFSPAGHAVAIKVIHAQFARDQEFLRRFSHEVAAASAVGGLYTAPVVDYDLNSSTPWLATAYVPGPTLATVISNHGALPEAALWRLAAGLAEALRAIHAKGLIHRDLKPANVLLADSGPHVIDFGISRASSSMTQLTSAGMAIGTPGYMSPEQAQVHDVGPPSDLFSLGCVLAYAATGTPPFNGDNPASILYKIVATEPDLSLVTPAFRQVVQACLKKNPAERPTPGQLIAMIGQLGPATPVTLGSFWPDAVARIIAVEQAAQTPAGLTPPKPFAGTTSTPGTGQATGMPGPTGAAGVSIQGAPGFSRPTGHAPMIADGYFAAARHPSSAAPYPPGPTQQPLSAPPLPYGAPPPSYGGQQPYMAPQPGAQGLSGQFPPSQAAFGQPTFGQAPAGPGSAAPYSGQAPAYGGQMPPYQGQVPGYPGQPYLGQPYPGQQPRPGNPARQYTPGRRRPMASEVPQAVRTAVGLMWFGLAVTAVDALESSFAYARYDHDVGVDTLHGLTQAANHANSTSGAVAVTMIADYLGLACWVLLAIAARRGHGWSRIAGLALLVIYFFCALFVLLGTHSDAGPQVLTVLVLAIGVAAVIRLWSRQARQFFLAWRRP